MTVIWRGEPFADTISSRREAPACRAGARAYNLADVKELRLSRKAYTGIFLGQVKKWNDPEIAKVNPGAKLPDASINVVVCADSSGTTYVMTKHLSAVSADFAKGPGTDKMPNWPVGTRSKGNEGVTGSLKSTPNSIGYVEYGYANGQKLPMALLENRAGAFVAATTAAGQAALASATMPSTQSVVALGAARPHDPTHRVAEPRGAPARTGTVRAAHTEAS